MLKSGSCFWEIGEMAGNFIKVYLLEMHFELKEGLINTA